MTPKPRPVRVCYVIDDFRAAGTEKQLARLLSAGLGDVRPCLVVTKGDETTAEQLKALPVRPLVLRWSSLRSPRSWLAIGRLALFLRRHRIDVVQFYFRDSALVGALAGLLAGAPVRLRVTSNCGHDLTRADVKVNNLLSAIVSGWLTNCHAARRFLENTQGRSAGKIAVVPNAVDAERFSGRPKVGRSARERAAVVLANLREVKGHATLLRAARHLRARGQGLLALLAGGGPLKKELEQTAEREGLKETVRLVGPAKNVPELLSRCTVGVLPSYSEGMSNALLEYGAAGLPVVSTDVGGSPEVVEHRVTGLLVPPGEPVALAEAMQTLADRPFLARKFGRAARRRALERHAHEDMEQSLVATYRDLLARTA